MGASARHGLAICALAFCGALLCAGAELGCSSRTHAGETSAPPVATSAPTVVSAAPSISSPARAAVASSAVAAARTGVPIALDPAARVLQRARLTALGPLPTADARLAADGVLLATLEDPAPSPGTAPAPRLARLSIAPASSPTSYRRPLAFARLAEALGAEVVPAMIEVHPRAGDVVALLEGQAVLLAKVRKQLAVLNDGTLTALLAAPAPSASGDAWATPVGKVVDVRGAIVAARWASWAAEPAPAPGESARLLRDYVEVLALDYLAAFGTRRGVLFVAEREALIADDNRDAFPDHVDHLLSDPLLRKLRAVARFPRGLRDALLHLDRARAEAAINRGTFQAWLLSPRALVELDERRAGLLSLIEAQIAQRGEAAVLTL